VPRLCMLVLTYLRDRAPYRQTAESTSMRTKTSRTSSAPQQHLELAKA
jgi:hypothetical protein